MNSSIILSNYLTGEKRQYSLEDLQFCEKIGLHDTSVPKGYFQLFNGRLIAIYRKYNLDSSPLMLIVDQTILPLSQVVKYEWKSNEKGVFLILYRQKEEIVWNAKIYSNDEWCYVNYIQDFEGSSNLTHLTHLLCNMIDAPERQITYLVDYGPQAP